MFCYTVAQSIDCVARELLLWSEISSQHPVFLLTVAQLTNKRLGREITGELNAVKERFSETGKCAKEFMNIGLGMFPGTSGIVKCLREFLEVDKTFIDILKKLKEYGKRDAVWQTLVEHIDHEQRYMYRLVETLLVQIDR